MASQLRIYTINRGMMDSWLRLFEDHIRPLHSKYGMLVENTWVNADRTEFIWVLSFDAEEIKEKAAEYAASPERQALGDRPDSHVAKRELLVIEPVLTGPR
jgi:hypothetical protein